MDITSENGIRRSHIENLGKMIEDMEIKMRNLLAEVYFSSKLPFSLSLSFLGGLELIGGGRICRNERYFG